MRYGASLSKNESEFDASQCHKKSPTPQRDQKEYTSENVKASSKQEHFDVSAQPPPYEVLTRLAENPSSDITQIVETGEQSDDQDADGVECSKAHNMLMQFATSEEKLNTISRMLEGGCVGKKDGGCKVRNEVIWRAIDETT